MEEAEFLALIQSIGEENVLSIGLDNSSAHVFREGNLLNMAEQYDTVTKTIRFISYTKSGHQYYTYKPISTVQTITARHSFFPMTEYLKDGDAARDLRG